MLKKLSRFICLALMILLIFAIAGCGKNAKFGPVTGGPANDEEVVSNGGMIIKKGEFYYFVNGIEGQSADNDFPNVRKGAIYRCTTDYSDYQVIVPKIILLNSKSEINIVGDYIYYTSPSTKKDKSGNVMSSNIDFCRTKLDGTSTQVLFTLDESTDYTIAEKGGKTYIAYSGVAVSTATNTSTTNIYSYCVDSGKTSVLAKNIETSGKIMVAYEGEIFYSKTVYWDIEQGQEIEDFNSLNQNQINYGTNLEKISIDGSNRVKLMSRTEDDKLYSASPSVIKIEGGCLYYIKNTAADSDLALWSVYVSKTSSAEEFKDNSIKLTPYANLVGDFIKLDDYTIIANVSNNVCILGYDVATKECKESQLLIRGKNIQFLTITRDSNSMAKDLYYIDTESSTIMCVPLDSDNYKDGEKVCDFSIDISQTTPEVIGDKVFFINTNSKTNEIQREEIEAAGEEFTLEYVRYYGYMYVYTLGGNDGKTDDEIGSKNTLPLIGYVIEDDKYQE